MKDALVHDNTLPNPHLEPFDAVKQESLAVQLTHAAGKSARPLPLKHMQAV
jgi:hypothetical protein